MSSAIPAKMTKGWRKLLVSCLALTLSCSGIWSPLAPKASAATGAPMVVSSLEGPVTQEEINSFKQYIFSSSVGLPVSNIGNDFVYGPSGQNVEAMGYMYEISGDQAILDRMISFSENMLSARNNPVTGRVLWNGNRELAWPNKKVGEVNSDGLLIEGYSGSENGDVIGHIAYSAKLILQNKSLWNKTVPIGNGSLYGETYLQRAKSYIIELDKSMDTYMIPNFVKPDTLRQYWPNDTRWSTTGSGAPNSAIPWNQQMMINNGFMRLAECHELLADDLARVDLYDRIVKASIDWFTASLEPYQVQGHDVYKWWYVADYFGKVEDADGVHAANDIMGMTRAYDRGKYGVTQDTLIKLANTIRYVISTGTGNFYCKVDGLPTSCTLTNLWSEYLHISPYAPDPTVYKLLTNPYYMSTVLTSPIYFARIMWAKDHTSWTQQVDADLSPTWEAESYSSREGDFTRGACDTCSKGAFMQSSEEEAASLTFDLNVTHGGSVYLHMLGSASGAGVGNLKVSLDGGTEVNLSTDALGWGWSTADLPFMLTDGFHQLTIKSQGNAAQLDKLVLSKSHTPPIESLLPKLTDIQINGVSITNFSPSTYAYSVAVPLGTKVIPTISAASSHIVEIAQPQQVFGTAIITVKDRQDPYLQAKYEVLLTGFPIYGEVPDRFISYPIQNVSASAGYHASFPPASAIDGDLTTRYAAKGITHWIQFDLGVVKPVRSVLIAFLKGDVDKYNFDLQVSEDGVSWKTVFSGKSSGKTAGLEIFQFGKENARYVKYNGKGNSKDTWNNINEIYVGGDADVTAPITSDDVQAGWHKDTQTIHLSATDGGSDVAHTYYSVNGSTFTEGTTIQIDSEGTTELRYYSVDGAGNEESPKSVTLQLDRSAPSMISTVSMSVYLTDAIDLDFGITDALSGIANQVILLDGKPVDPPYVIEPMSLTWGNHVISVTATDRAGNSTTQQFNLQVQMDLDHLDEVITIAKQKGWIKNEGIYRGLMTLVNLIQKASKLDLNPKLYALQALVQAQKGKFIEESTAVQLLDWLKALQN
ncbi:discoidin domain-containing protein [Paenibacillus sp. 2RAB27]|uniref:OmpL47-type beta-barrel domain-containing protein n=1 Tax=Paenibacillus sp. 2RAB27 TaxID=3232991 RepID=UPI003F973A1B